MHTCEESRQHRRSASFLQMSHIVDVKESCWISDSAELHISVGHVMHLPPWKDSHDTHIDNHVARNNEECHIFVRGVPLSTSIASFLEMRLITLINGHVARGNESCHKSERVVSHSTCLDLHTCKQSCCLWECVVQHVWKSGVTQHTHDTAHTSPSS